MGNFGARLLDVWIRGRSWEKAWTVFDDVSARDAVRIPSSEKMTAAAGKESRVSPAKPMVDDATDDGTVDSSQISKAEGDDTPFLDFRNATEWISFVAGVCILLLVGPPVGLVVFASMIWEAIDRRFEGGFVDSGKELTGFLFTKFIPWLEESTH